MLKSSVTFHAVGDVPFAKVRDAESQASVPVAKVYIENTFPFAPAVLVDDVGRLDITPDKVPALIAELQAR